MENMSEATASRVLNWLSDQGQAIETIDLTGGSPEMNSNFRRLVKAARQLGIKVIDRCNPTILAYTDTQTPTDFRWVPRFLAENEVEVVASLPCYLEDNVRAQRGLTAYESSIDGLQQLNAVGYGRDPRLRLNLVYNPTGAHLPPPQASLADDYRRELKQRFDLDFHELWTITNMPIQRWRDDLQRQGRLDDYMQLLIESWNPATVDGLMCRHQIHIDSQGRLFDCDFNYAVGLTANVNGVSEATTYLWDVTYDQLQERFIAVDNHCYGCTAGAGSSCGGAIEQG